jgi:site-specific DNA-methyltransferase (adenine-specific)
MPLVKSPLPYRLYNEDCFATFARLGAGTVDLVLCDPPYGTTQCAWDSVIPIAPMWEQLHRVCKPNAAIVLTAMQPFSSVLVTSNLARFKYEWVWRKSIATGFLNAKHMPIRIHEQVLVFYSGRATYNAQGLKNFNQVAMRGGSGEAYGDCGGTNWQEKTNWPKDLIDFPSEGLVHGHPNQKPLALMSYLLKTYSNPGDTVLDFAMGSGTTGVACMVHGRKFIGCDSDMSNGYFDTAELRIKTAYRQNWGKQRAESS